MKRSTKIVLFLVLAAGTVAADGVVQLCCGIPSCIPGTNCTISK